MRANFTLLFIFTSLILGTPPLVAVVGMRWGWGEFGMIGAGVLVLAFASILAWLSSGFLSRVRDLNQSAQEISRGVLSRQVPVRHTIGAPEIDELTTSIGFMQENLKELVRHIQLTAGSVSEAAGELENSAERVNAASVGMSSSMEKIAAGAEYQHDLVERSSKVISEIADSINHTATSAEKAAKVATASSGAAQTGGRSASQAGQRLGKVFSRIEKASTMVIDFGNKTQQIDKVVSVISTVAQQTNLLALNATIEAARAGEYGRGFAVVAEEVRKLAEQASSSADQVSRLAETINRDADMVVSAMREATEELGEGREELDTIIDNLQGIAEQTKQGAEQVDSISLSAKEQLKGSEEMVRATTNIAEVAKDNARSTDQVRGVISEQTGAMRQMAASAREILSLSKELQSVVSRFRL